MASSVSSNGGSNNVMMRSKADSMGAAGGGGTSLDERNATVATMMAAASTATGVAAGPERSAVTTTADDSAISFSEEEEEDDVDGDDEEDDSGSVAGADGSTTNVAFNAAAAAAAAAAAFQRQILANFPMFDGKLDGDFLSAAANPAAMLDPSANGGNNNNPFESYIAAAAAAAANAEALFRHQQQLTALSGSGPNHGRTSEKRSAAHDSGTDDNDLPMSGSLGKSMGSSARNSSTGIQQPSNKRRKQSKPVRISSDSGHEDNPAVTAFLAAQTAAAAALFNPNRTNGSSEDDEEEEEGSDNHLAQSGATGSIRRQRNDPASAMDWRMNPMVMMAAAAAAAAAGNNESEQEEGQIIRSSSPPGGGSMLDQQLAHRFNTSSAASSSSARQFAEFLASAGGSGAKGFLPPSAAYGGNWNQQQQHMMMSMMAMNRSGNGMMMPGLIADDGEVSRGSSRHSSGSPNNAGSHPDGKKNEESSERPHSGSPLAFRHMANKYGGFFPASSVGGASLTFAPSTPSGAHPFLFPFLSSSGSAAGHSPSASQAMRGGMNVSPSMGGGGGGSIRIFNHEAYCELCNKEFCNKYFLKTHKANKHGIYVDNIPTTSSATSTTNGGAAPGEGRQQSTVLTSSTSNNPMTGSSYGPPLSLTVGAMTYPMHPPSSNAEPGGIETPTTAAAVASYSPNSVIQSSSSKYPTVSSVVAPTTTATTPVSAGNNNTVTPTSSSSSPSSTSMNNNTASGMNAAAAAAAAAAAGLMDFFPMWSTTTPTTPSVTTINNSLAGSSLGPSMVSMKPHLPSGIINPEAYCELCQKEFCNKYFLKRHKAKMHGIVPPDGTTGSTTSSSNHPGATSSSGGGSSHKRHKSQAPKSSSSAVDLIKIPLTTLPSSTGGGGSAGSVVTSPLASHHHHPAGGINEQLPPLEHFPDSTGHHHDSNLPTTPSTATSSTPFSLLMASGMVDTTGGSGSALGAGSAKIETINTASRDSLSLLKIPTPSLSNLFSTPHSGADGHPPASRHHHRPSSSSCPTSSVMTTGHHSNNQPTPPHPPTPQQQLFSPERLRQMGVINTEAFCEICCKEFCNKYFLRTHKFKKHGIGSMPEQPQHQQQQQQSTSSSHPMSESSSAGMIHQHININNNNNKNASPAGKQSSSIHPEGNEQKTPLNLASSSSSSSAVATTTVTSNAAHPASGGTHSQQTDGGMPLSCDLCQRPFQSTYLLHMHRTYFHNQPPPPPPTMDGDGPAETDAASNSNAAALEDDNTSDRGGDNGTRHSTDSPPAVTVKSEPGIVNRPVVDGGADASMEESSIMCDANTSGSGITISADLQKLQSMIMELNGSSAAAAAAAAAAASMAQQGENDASAIRNRRFWMDSPSKNSNQPGHHEVGGNNMHYISGSGGGIVKILNPGDLSETGASSASVQSTTTTNTTTTATTSMCQLCGNKDFFTPYFLQMHMQNYHGIGAGNGSSDPSAAAMEAAVAAAASQLGLDRLLEFGASSSLSGQQNGGGHSGSGMKRSGRSSSSASPAATRSYCQICNKELCNKYFMKTHMLKMHGIHLEASGGGAQIGGVQCDICHKELCSKYFLKVHKQNTHGIGFTDHDHVMTNGMMNQKDQSPLQQHHHIQGVMDLSFQHQSMTSQSSMPDVTSPTKPTPESCPLCPKRFKSIKALKAHLSHDHSANAAALSGTQSSSPSTCCYICNQQFNDVVALQVHLIKTHASHLMDHQTPPPPVPPATPTTSSTPAAGTTPGLDQAGHQQQQQQGSGASSASSSASSSPSSKTSPSFQCSYCDFNTVSLPYLFAHERSHHPSSDPASGSAAAVPASSPSASSGHRIQCPLCGQALPLEQFQTHLMAHQLPINFLHTLMPTSAVGGGRANEEDDDEDDEDEAEINDRLERSFAIQRQEPRRKHVEDLASNQQQSQKRKRRRRRYRCSVCSRKFRTRQLCLTHILQRHPPSIRSAQMASLNSSLISTKSSGSPTSPVSTLMLQQRPLTCPRCGYTTRQPQLLRLHLRTQQCIPVVARNPDLQQLPPYLAVPTSTASVGHSSGASRAVNNNGLLQVQGQHAHRQDFVLQAFLLTQPESSDVKSSGASSSKNRRSKDAAEHQQSNGHVQQHHSGDEEPLRAMKDESERVRAADVDSTEASSRRESGVDNEVKGEDDEEGQSCNFIPSLILLPVNRRIANPLSLTFSLTPA